MDALYTALSGLIADTGALNQVAGNMANQMNPGYLSQIGQTVDGIQQTVFRVGGSGTMAIGTVPSGVVYTNSVLTAPSAVQSTGVSTDLAIAGNGFFAVKTATGTQYTRNGAFSVNPNGRIVNEGGGVLLDQNQQPLVINPTQSFQVANDGTVSQNGIVVGTIGLYQLPGASLTSGTNGLYQTNAKAVAAANASVVQGSLDGSNVSLNQSIQSLIQAQGSYQSLTTLVNAESKRLSTAGGLGVLA
ncbi:MAG: flagellar hook basal-body protein [Firmicutes bacterium]|jgi:flagellar basal body rod protein FlgG|nr:flagellar hook basal-body protein [Bacillota bacterium]MCL5065649.1 flagellar hook basal-body protein [Bacillota bacterium]